MFWSFTLITIHNYIFFDSLYNVSRVSPIHNTHCVALLEIYEWVALCKYNLLLYLFHHREYIWSDILRPSVDFCVCGFYFRFRIAYISEKINNSKFNYSLNANLGIQWVQFIFFVFKKIKVNLGVLIYEKLSSSLLILSIPLSVLRHLILGWIYGHNYSYLYPMQRSLIKML